MKLIHTLVISNKKWKVIKQKWCGDAKGRAAGMAKEKDRVIKVTDFWQNIEATQITLIHELLHALGWSYGFELRDIKKKLATKVIECQIDRVAYALVKFNAANPEFWPELAQQINQEEYNVKTKFEREPAQEKERYDFKRIG
jgi:hypothetical protein